METTRHISGRATAAGERIHRVQPRLRPILAALPVAFAILAPWLPAAGSDGFDSPGPGDSLSIADCAQLAHQLAPSVRTSIAERQAAGLDSAAVAHNRRPAFAFFGGATVAPEGYYDPAFTNLGEYQLKAGMEWPVLDGGSRRRERARGALGAGLAVLVLEQVERDAGLRAAALAADILRLREQESWQRDSLDWLERLESVVKSGERAGTRGPADALRVTLEHDQVEAALESTTRDIGISRRELGQLLGKETDSTPAVREPDPAEDRPPSDEDSLRVIGSAERAPEVRIAKIGEAQKRLDLNDAEKRNALRVDLAADAGLAGTDLTRTVPPDLLIDHPDATFGDRLRRDLGASVAFQFKLPFLDPAVRPAAEARRASAHAASLSLTTAIETQRRLSLDLLARWRAASLRLIAAQGAADRASANVLRFRSLYAAGATTLLDLLDARRLLDDARDRLAEARFEARLARFEAETRR